MGSEDLMPTVDRRFTEWINRQNELKKKEAPRIKPTICISRQFGCEAYPLALSLQEQLTAQLGLTFALLDRIVIDWLLAEHGFEKGILDASQSRLPSGGREILDFLFSADWKPPQERAYILLTQYLERIARVGQVIIIGRGASILLQSLPNTYHFRLEAPLDYRIGSLARRLNLPWEEAKKMVLHGESAREKFIEAHFNCRINQNHFFHAIFNNSRIPVDRMASYIIDIACGTQMESLSSGKKASNNLVHVDFGLKDSA